MTTEEASKLEEEAKAAWDDLPVTQIGDWLIGPNKLKAAFLDGYLAAARKERELWAALNDLVNLVDSHQWGEGPTLRTARAALAAARKYREEKS